MLWVLAILLIVLGLAGAVLPGLPGPLLVFAGILTAAWADDFARIGVWTLLLLGMMTAAAHLVDLVSAAIGVRRAGASRRAVAGAGLGALAGLFFGLPGVIIGPFVGAALAELTVRPDLRGAGRAGLAAWIGFIVGSIAKLAIIVAMLAIALVSFVWR
jgi:uncharacterized protein